MSRIEIVQTDAEQPWHGRIVASNGEPLWHTENLTDYRAVVVAVLRLPGMSGAIEKYNASGRLIGLSTRDVGIEVRYVDERRAVEVEPVLCPECAQGKTSNCVGVALDFGTDDFVTCENAVDTTTSGQSQLDPGSTTQPEGNTP